MEVKKISLKNSNSAEFAWVRQPRMQRGILSTLTSGQEWKGLAPYQEAWMRLVWDWDVKKCILVGSRFSAKTFTTALALFRLMTITPGLRVTCLPGGKLEQAKVAMRYMRAFCRFYPRIKGTPWTATKITLINGSSFSIAAPTEKGVQSERANVIWVDEAQLVEREIYELVIFQMGARNAKIVLTGTAAFPSVLFDEYNKLPQEACMMVPYRLPMEAGVVALSTVEEIRKTVAGDTWRAMMECEWVRKSDRVFNPIFDRTPEFVEMGVLAWDFNPVAGHWGVIACPAGGKIHVVKEFVARTIEEVVAISNTARVEAVVLEDGGTNAGYCDAIVGKARNAVRDKWDAVEKGKQVARVIRGMEEGRVVIDAESCRELARDVTLIPFNMDGMPDKREAERLGLNMHVVDAMIHAVSFLLKREESVLEYLPIKFMR